MSKQLTYIIKQGEDRIISCFIYQDGIAVDLTGASIKVVAKLISQEATIDKFSSYTISGFGLLTLPTVGATDVNEVKINVVRNKTKDYTVGNYQIVILVEETTGADIEPKRTEYNLGTILTIAKGYTRDISEIV